MRRFCDSEQQAVWEMARRYFFHNSFHGLGAFCAPLLGAALSCACLLLALLLLKSACTQSAIIVQDSQFQALIACAVVAAVMEICCHCINKRAQAFADNAVESNANGWQDIQNLYTNIYLS